MRYRWRRTAEGVEIFRHSTRDDVLGCWTVCIAAGACGIVLGIWANSLWIIALNVVVVAIMAIILRRQQAAEIHPIFWTQNDRVFWREGHRIDSVKIAQIDYFLVEYHERDDCYQTKIMTHKGVALFCNDLAYRGGSTQLLEAVQEINPSVDLREVSL